MTRRSGLILSIGFLVALAGLSVLAGGSGVQAQEEETALDGQELFETYKCNMCHAVPAAEIEAKTKSEAMRGSDLGGKIEADPEVLAAYLRKAGKLDGGEHKTEFKGTDEELQAIIDWLGSLEAQQ